MNTPQTAGALTLKPCPFCGAEAHGYAIEAHTHHFKFPDGSKMPDHAGSYVIEGRCACGSGLIGETEVEVTAAWNRRILSAPGEEVEMPEPPVFMGFSDITADHIEHTAAQKDWARTYGDARALAAAAPLLVRIAEFEAAGRPKPMTEAEIIQARRDTRLPVSLKPYSETISLARAVEQHHGIHDDDAQDNSGENG